MKKLAAILLLFLSLAGTFIPCCLEDDCDDIAMAQNADHEHKGAGNCSPFFSCGTCAPGLDLWAIQVSISEIITDNVPHASFYQFQLGSYANQMFQPPRM